MHRSFAQGWAKWSAPRRHFIGRLRRIANRDSMHGFSMQIWFGAYGLEYCIAVEVDKRSCSLINQIIAFECPLRIPKRLVYLSDEHWPNQRRQKWEAFASCAWALQFPRMRSRDYICFIWAVFKLGGDIKSYVNHDFRFMFGWPVARAGSVATTWRTHIRTNI